MGIRITLFNYANIEADVVVTLADAPDYKFVHVEEFGEVKSCEARTYRVAERFGNAAIHPILPAFSLIPLFLCARDEFRPSGTGSVRLALKNERCRELVLQYRSS